MPFGYLGGSVDDAARLVVTLLADSQDGSSRLLDGQTLAEAWEPAVAAAGASYGLGWRTEVQEGHTVVWHSGATPGYFATVLMAPGDGLGVAVLANGYSAARDAQLNEAAFDLLRIVRGDAPRPVGPDRWLLVVPWTLLAVAVLPVVATLVRSRGGRSPTRAGTIAWLLGCATLAGAAHLGLPGALGLDWRSLSLWAPDVAVGARAVVVGCLLAAAVSVVHLGLDRSRHREVTQAS